MHVRRSPLCELVDWCVWCSKHAHMRGLAQAGVRPHSDLGAPGHACVRHACACRAWHSIISLRAASFAASHTCARARTWCRGCCGHSDGLRQALAPVAHSIHPSITHSLAALGHLSQALRMGVRATLCARACVHVVAHAWALTVTLTRRCAHHPCPACILTPPPSHTHTPPHPPPCKADAGLITGRYA